MEDVASNDSSMVSEMVEDEEEDDDEEEEELEEIEEGEEEIIDEEIEEMEEEVEEGEEEGGSTGASSVGQDGVSRTPTTPSSASQKSAKSPAGRATSSSATTATSASASPAAATSTTTMLEGANIHFSADGKKLCSHSTKVCKQRRMEGRGFCIKHILEDPTSGFRQCEYLCKKKGNRRCTNPVPPPHDDVVYCSHHRQILGLQPRTAIKRGQGKTGKSRADLRTKGAHTALMNVLSKHGIPEKSLKRKGTTTPKKIKLEEAQPAADEDESSDEFPSDDEENGEEADVESGSEDAISDDLDRDFDNDGFIPDSFLWHLENDKTTTAFDPLQDQQVLTEEEILQRRKAKVVKLLQLYKLQYYRLQDNLQSSFELYNKKVALEREKQGRTGEGKKYHGKGTGDKRNKPKKDQEQEDQLRALYIHSKEAKVKLDGNIGYCQVPECRLRALTPSDFCLTHILRDPKQQLYIGCTYAKGEWHAARGHTCGYPILRTTQPPLCDAHMDASAEQLELAASAHARRNKKKRKASQLLEERDKDKAREREKAQRESKSKKQRSPSKSKSEGKTKKSKKTADFISITSANASQYPLALVLAKVDYNVGIIQEKRGVLLDEENEKRRQQEEAGDSDNEEEDTNGDTSR